MSENDSDKRKSINSLSGKEKHEDFVKPDGGYGWVILIVAFLISFIVDGCMYSFGIILVEIKNHFNETQDIVNLVQSLNVGFLFLSGTVLSGLAGQFGVRPVVMAGALVFSLMYVLCAYVPSIYLMILFFGLIGGIAFACTYNALFIILVDYFDLRLGIANGMTMAGSGLGAFAFAPFAKYLVTSLGWQKTMLVLGGLTFLCFGLGTLLRPVDYYRKTTKDSIKMKERIQSPESESLKKDQHDESVHVHFDESTKSDKKESPKDIFLEILREIGNFKLLVENKMLLMIVISNFFTFLCYFTPFTYIPIQAKRLDLEHYAWVISIIGITNIPFRILFGYLADRKFLSSIDMNTICILIATVTMYGYYYLKSFYEQAIFAVIFAIAMAGLNCLTTNYVVEIAGANVFANAFGLISIARGLGAMIGPFLTGSIFEKTDSTYYVFLTTGISYSISFVFTLIISINQFMVRRRNTMQNSSNSEI